MKSDTTCRLFTVSLLTLLTFLEPATAQVEEAWVARYNDRVSVNNRAVAVAVDGDGNVYITGGCRECPRDRAYSTVKYDPRGNRLWTAEFDYDSPEFRDALLKIGSNVLTHEARAIAVDGTGNVYVVGDTTTDSSITSNHVPVTLKYDPVGNQLWAVTEARVGRLQEEFGGLAVDGDGNVLVTRTVFRRGEGEDGFETVKYDFAGTRIWSARFDSLDNREDDRPLALIVAGEASVYVMGTSMGTPGRARSASAVKYDEAGNELWRVRLESVSFGGGAVDDEGNLYLAGSLSDDGTQIGRDYMTVAFDPDGDELWTARHELVGPDRPVAVAVGPDRTVYVTGSSSGDYLTVAYDSEGEELWAALYDYEFEETAVGIAVDASGTVLVTGTSSGDYATIAYDDAGNELWIERYDGPAAGVDTATALAIDGAANVYVTGGSEDEETGEDALTVKYSPRGDVLWVARDDQVVDTDDFAQAMAVDGEGNVYVTGLRWDGGLGFLTVKYDPEGRQLWRAPHEIPLAGGNGGRNDRRTVDLAVDRDTSVYVTGARETVKYDLEGNELWTSSFDAPTRNSWSTVVAADDAGSVFVAGTFRSEATWDYFTVKYDSDGVQLWGAVLDGPAGEPTDLVAADDGSVVVTGMRGRTVKFDSEGNRLWAASGDFNGYPLDATFDSMGRVYVAGGSAVAKYAPDGELLWRGVIPGGQGSALIVDAGRNVYVTGWTTGPGFSGRDLLTFKYDPEGKRLWGRPFKANAHWDSYTSLGIALDGTGGVYIAGPSERERTGQDYTLVHYDSDGNEVETARYSGPAPADGPLPRGLDSPRAILADGDGNIYVTGVSMDPTNHHLDYATVKYTRTIGFLRGDCNGDRNVNGIADAVFLLSLNFVGNVVVPCRAACDVNGDGAIGGVTDAIALFSYSFQGGPPPAPPFPECGPGELETDNALGCEQPTPCSQDG